MIKKPHPSRPAAPAGKAVQAARRWRQFLPLGLTFSLTRLLRAEDHVDYRYEYYDEEGKRMKIETHSVYFEQKLIDCIIAKGELVYDGISGATPTGTYYYPPSNGRIRTTTIWDLRRAENIELDCRLGNHTITPGFAHSEEHDYQSYGLSLNDAIEFNDKNTILQLGASHNFDSVRRYPNETIWSGKDATEGIIGVSQLLSPKTIFSADFTFGYEDGYLSDPYRSVEFVYTGHPFGSVRNENRPGHRSKEVGLVTLTHHFDSLDASLEGSYRLYHDSYGIFAHTFGLTWHQWLGRHLMVEPAFRFYQQGSADFYQPLFHVSPATINVYSSDYRLSEFYSLDYGLQATVLINDHLRVTAGYHRYEMRGLDNTPSAAYPKANIFTVGLSILW